MRRDANHGKSSGHCHGRLRPHSHEPATITGMEQNPYEAPHNSEETPKAAPRVENTGLLFTAGVAAMLFALLFQNVTLTRNSYRDVLVIALSRSAIEVKLGARMG